jgi:hypothetical protein
MSNFDKTEIDKKVCMREMFGCTLSSYSYPTSAYLDQ